MKREELQDIVDLIFSTYPSFYNAEEKRKKLSAVLYETIRKEDYEFIKGNLIKHIRISKFPPSPAELLADDELKQWGSPVVIEEVPEKTPEEIARIKAIIAKGKRMLAESRGEKE